MFRRRESGLSSLDAGEGVEVALVGAREGVKVFLVVWIWKWLMRSMTDLRSAPPASSQVAWAWRRSRTPTSMPEALMAGSQMRVRKVLR